MKHTSFLDQNMVPQIPEKINWSLKGEHLVKSNAPSFASLIEIVRLDEHPWTPSFETKLEDYIHSLNTDDKLGIIISERKEGLDKNDFDKWLKIALARVNDTH